MLDKLRKAFTFQNRSTRTQEGSPQKNADESWRSMRARFSMNKGKKSRTFFQRKKPSQSSTKDTDITVFSTVSQPKSATGFKRPYSPDHSPSRRSPNKKRPMDNGDGEGCSQTSATLDSSYLKGQKVPAESYDSIFSTDTVFDSPLKFEARKEARKAEEEKMKALRAQQKQDEDLGFTGQDPHSMQFEIPNTASHRRFHSYFNLSKTTGHKKADIQEQRRLKDPDEPIYYQRGDGEWSALYSNPEFEDEVVEQMAAKDTCTCVRNPVDPCECDRGKMKQHECLLKSRQLVDTEIIKRMARERLMNQLGQKGGNNMLVARSMYDMTSKENDEEEMMVANAKKLRTSMVTSQHNYGDRDYEDDGAVPRLFAANKTLSGTGSLLNSSEIAPRTSGSSIEDGEVPRLMATSSANGRRRNSKIPVAVNRKYFPRKNTGRFDILPEDLPDE